MTVKSWLYLMLALLILPLVAKIISEYVEAMDCYGPDDKDRVNHCLALLKDEPGYCNKIKDGDLMHFCTAQVTETPDSCSAIKAPEVRLECLDMAEQANTAQQ